MVEDCRARGAGAGGRYGCGVGGRRCQGVLDRSGVGEKVSVEVGVWAECVRM